MRNQVSEFRSHLVPKLRSHELGRQMVPGEETNDQGSWKKSDLEGTRKFRTRFLLGKSWRFHAFSMFNCLCVYFQDFSSDFRFFCVDETLDVIVVGHSNMMQTWWNGCNGCLARRLGNRNTWHGDNCKMQISFSWLGKQSKHQQEQVETARGICWL